MKPRSLGLDKVHRPDLTSPLCTDGKDPLMMKNKGRELLFVPLTSNLYLTPYPTSHPGNGVQGGADRTRGPSKRLHAGMHD